jgi:hypothetical protein
MSAKKHLNKLRRLQKVVLKNASNEIHSLDSYLKSPMIKRVEVVPEVVKHVMADQLLEDKLTMKQVGWDRYNLLKRKLVSLFVSGRYTLREMSRILFVSEKTLSLWLREEKVRDAISRYQLEEDAIIQASLRALRVRAITKAGELMDGAENEMVQAILIRDILDRTGHKAVEKKQVDVNVTYEERLKKLIDADYTVDSDGDKINTEGEDK